MGHKSRDNPSKKSQKHYRHPNGRFSLMGYSVGSGENPRTIRKYLMKKGQCLFGYVQLMGPPSYRYDRG